jgi:alkaline phosphatase D
MPSPQDLRQRRITDGENNMTRILKPWRSLSRRSFLRTAAVGGIAAAGLVRPFNIVRAQAALPALPHGVMSGDIAGDSAVIWARCDRPARLMVEYATTESFADARRVTGSAALPETDLTARVVLGELEPGQELFYRVRFEDLADLTSVGEPVAGRLRTAPAERRDIRFLWSGDTAGQGWGINTDWGGMKIYEAMRQRRPDFFIHSGDTIYADGPIKAEVPLPDGTVWKNVVLEEKAKVAETLAEFRASYKYNLMDENVRRFNAEVAQIFQWDDHETTNNWYPSEVLPGSEERYKDKSVALLAARAKRAFLEYIPIRPELAALDRIHRTIHYGPLLDVFVIDMRSFRGPNTGNRQDAEGPDTVFLGRTQMEWLKRDLLASRAVWKVIASDMPIGIIVPDGDTAFENMANGDGPALGREMETARLLSFIKHSEIRNVVWVTADVHYTAAHYYDPAKAQFTDFAPFWEFVSGPLNAGTFGPGKLDNSFGPQLMFVKAPPEGQANLPPSAGLQFFGEAEIDGQTAAMTVTLRDLDGAELYKKELAPEYT